VSEGAAPPAAAAPRAARLGVAEYAAGVRACDRTVLGRALTLVESNTLADQKLAQELLVQLLPDTGKAFRIGVSGVPGVGKSTFIETFGMMLVELGHRVAVLAIDPSSGVTGGSILGDKTRMARLSRDGRAFIRPSPSSGSLGGVARKTRESVLVCEAAGFDVVLVETVGVGQSEMLVADLVDTFLVLMLPGGGDELQGIKRGILEHADVLAVNKADASPELARNAKRDYSAALRVLRAGAVDQGGWSVPVTMISALTGSGLPELWAELQRHKELMQASGRFEARRKQQLLQWMWSLVEERVLVALRSHPDVAARAPQLEAAILSGKMTPTLGAKELLEAFGIED
jgi:LAO/AO transport system kinase